MSSLSQTIICDSTRRNKTHATAANNAPDAVVINGSDKLAAQNDLQQLRILGASLNLKPVRANIHQLLTSARHEEVFNIKSIKAAIIGYLRSSRMVNQLLTVSHGSRHGVNERTKLASYIPHAWGHWIS